MSEKSPERLEVVEINVWPVNVALEDSFVTARGSQQEARNLFVRVRLASGVSGFGEIAPFEGFSGEDQAASEDAAKGLARLLIGQSAAQYRKISQTMVEMVPRHPAARCGLEMAILDAYCRSLEIPFWALFGGKTETTLRTDITIPILSLGRSLVLAESWYRKGFRTFKLKVGTNLDEDVERVRRIANEYPEISFVLDANQGFSEEDAFRFLKEIEFLGPRLLLFEQPVAGDNFSGLRALRELGRVPIVADESVSTPNEAIAIVQNQAADVINLKVMKSGILDTLAIATVARAAGLGLMIGGMVETRLAMSCSLAIAVALGQFRVLDLDTPLLLTEDPLWGGYEYRGPEMVTGDEPGLGMEPKKIPT